MRPVSRRHSSRGLVGGSTFRRTPISRAPLDKNPMPGHLSELPPVNAVNTKGQFFVHRSEKTPGSKYSSTSGLSPRAHLERQAEFHASTQDEARLSGPQSAGTLRSESEIRGSLRFLPQLEMRPSSNAPNPRSEERRVGKECRSRWSPYH